MSNAPAIVRFLRFPETLRLSRKGNQFEGPLQRSGPLVLSERHGAVDVTFRLTTPGFSFLTGGTAIKVTEAFSEGEQRDVLVPWQLVAENDQRVDLLVMEIDVAYTGTSDVHTATVPLQLEYGISRRKAAVAAGTALAAAAVAAVAASRRKRTVIADDEEDVELSLFNFAPTAKTTSPRTPVKDATVTVRDADEVDVAVLNVGRTPARRSPPAKARPAASRKASSKKKTAPVRKSSTKKSSAKKSPTKKASAKKSSTKKSSKKAPARKAGGTRRGSTASRSARRTGARGSSVGRKSAARRSTRKSR